MVKKKKKTKLEQEELKRNEQLAFMPNRPGRGHMTSETTTVDFCAWPHLIFYFMSY